eukprot:6610063-Alexandrium_andersonii.AAC.1
MALHGGHRLRSAGPERLGSRSGGRERGCHLVELFKRTDVHDAFSRGLHLHVGHQRLGLQDRRAVAQ